MTLTVGSLVRYTNKLGTKPGSRPGQHLGLLIELIGKNARVLTIHGKIKRYPIETITPVESTTNSGSQQSIISMNEKENEEFGEEILKQQGLKKEDLIN